MRKTAILAGALALFLGAAFDRPAKADDAASFYAGKQIIFLIPTTPGGGFDLYSRTLMEFMRKHIPGEPTVVLQNMTGAGGIRAANYLFNVAPKDGTVIGMPLSNVPFSEALDPGSVKYRSVHFNWIGTVTAETEVLGVWHTSGVTTVADTRNKELVIAGTSKLAMPTLNAALMKALLGSKFRIVMGYPAGIETILAMEKGEVQGRFNEWTSWKNQRPQWIEEKKLNFIVQLGPKEKELPQVPSFIDLVKDPREQAMVRLLQSNQFVGRSIYAPPGIPADRLAALREAFDKTMHDPDYLARMKQLKLDVNPKPGAELQSNIEQTMETADTAARDIKQRLGL